MTAKRFNNVFQQTWNSLKEKKLRDRARSDNPHWSTDWRSIEQTLKNDLSFCAEYVSVIILFSKHFWKKTFSVYILMVKRNSIVSEVWTATVRMMEVRQTSPGWSSGLQATQVEDWLVIRPPGHTGRGQASYQATQAEDTLVFWPPANTGSG